MTWTVTESALALIAGSLVAFRPLVRRWFGGSSYAVTEPLYNTPGRTGGGRSDKYVRSHSQDGMESPIGLETIVRPGTRNKDSSRRAGDGDTESQENIVDKETQITVTRTITMVA